MLMAAFSNAVDDALIGGELHDPVLAILLELLLEERSSGRFVFPDITSEPILYRQMRQIVNQTIAALNEVDKVTKQLPGLEGLWTPLNSSKL